LDDPALCNYLNFSHNDNKTVCCYLGEQGALSMMPMFLLDQKVDPTELTFWTGVVGQVVSICGSLAGGWFVTAFR
jgi:hypothetical protein